MFTSPQSLAAGDLIREEMARGIPFRFRVISSSMAPMIRVGDRVAVSKVGVDDLRRGDIVLYTLDDVFRIHRLLSVQRQGSVTWLLTKGDNALDTDRLWNEEQLLGKVVSIERGGQRIALGSRRWQVMNRFLGALAQMEVAVFQAGRTLKRALFGKQRRLLTSFAARLIVAPFRLCGRLLVLLTK